MEWGVSAPRVKYLMATVYMCCMQLCARLTSNQTTPLFLAVIRQIDALHNGPRQVNTVQNPPLCRQASALMRKQGLCCREGPAT
jgi:hypothetical protein